MPRIRRSFDAGFKAKIVLELLTGSASQAELCRHYKLNAQLLSRWKEIVLERLPSLFEDGDQPNQFEARIAELEQLVGRQALELEILKKASRLLPGLSSRNGRSS